MNLPAVRFRLGTCWLALLLGACAAQPAETQTAGSASSAVASVADSATTANQSASSTAATPALRPSTSTAASERTAEPSRVAAPSSVAPDTAATAIPSAAISSGDVVLRVAAGGGPGQVGIVPSNGPQAFRIAADNSIRIMDTVNRRLLFWRADGTVERTIDLASTQRPVDFAVSGQGNLFVFDTGGWEVVEYHIDGQELRRAPLSPELRGKAQTLSLTADGRLYAIGGDRSYLLWTTGGPVPVESQVDNVVNGAMTVRSNASFAIIPGAGDEWALSINTSFEQVQLPVGAADAAPGFLDINQGMQPYVHFERGSTAEVRRYDVSGTRLGALAVEQRDCLPALRTLYVDRGGDVWTMCGDEAGVTIARHTITGPDGAALPRIEELNSDAVWSPDRLPAAPA